jgi:carotenoid cleavage dioxygenase
MHNTLLLTCCYLFLQESAAGWPVFLKVGDYVGLGGLGLIFLERAKTALGLVDKTAGGGTAITALACHAGRLLALNEGDMPHALRVMCDGLVEAIGRVTVTGAVGRSFTAHPKLDPVTGGRCGCYVPLIACQFCFACLACMV